MCETCLVFGMQDKELLQIELEYQRNRAELAEASAQRDGIRAEETDIYLYDAYSQIDYLEWQLNKMFYRMRKVATGIHLAINPHHQVRQSLSTTSPSPCPEHLGCRPVTWILVFGGASVSSSRQRRFVSVSARWLVAVVAAVAQTIRFDPAS